MLLALLLVIIATAGGIALSYLYDKDAPFLVRLAMGLTTGLTAQGLVVFALALHFGLSIGVMLLGSIPFLTPLLIFRDQQIRQRFSADLQRQLHFRGRSKHRFAHLLISLALLGMLLWVFQGAIYYKDGGIWTRNHQNYGDLPWHIALVRGFTVGGNYPPEHLQFAGSRLTYPYLMDFITAEFNACGANIVQAFLLANLTIAFSLLALLQHWAFRLTRSPFVMIATPFLLFFNGGWGWWMLFSEIPASHKPIWEFFLNLPHDYTMYQSDYRWGSTLTVLFTTQRSILLGVPLALIALTQLYAALRYPEQRLHRLLAAGFVTGLLPLAHTHTGLVLLTIAFLYALPELFRRRMKPKASWKDWLTFFFPAFALMAPQFLMLLSGTSAHTSHYFGWEIGWDRSGQNPFVFWLRNTGPFLPLLLISLFWRGKHPVVPPLVRKYYLPFIVWLILPNLLRFAPWVWDNIKVLIYGYLGSIPIVLLLLSRLWQRNRVGKITALSLLVMMTLAGAVDVFRIGMGELHQTIYSAEEMAFGEAVNKTVPPACRILHAPEHNHAVTYAGRRLLCGYGGHLWSHGFDYQDRANDVKLIYAGAPNADQLLAKYQVQYIVDGPPEHHEDGFIINEGYLSKFPIVVSVGEYHLLRVR